LSSIAIRLGIAKSTTIIPLQGNNGTCTQSSIESTTALRTIGISRTRAGDELSSRGAHRIGCWTRHDDGYQGGACLQVTSGGTVGGHIRIRCRTSKADSYSSNVVGFGVAKTASSVSFLRNNGSGALPCVEATTTICAVGIGSAGACNELSASSEGERYCETTTSVSGLKIQEVVCLQLKKRAAKNMISLEYFAILGWADNFV
jgi:hypothetical protein